MLQKDIVLNMSVLHHLVSHFLCGKKKFFLHVNIMTSFSDIICWFKSVYSKAPIERVIGNISAFYSCQSQGENVAMYFGGETKYTDNCVYSHRYDSHMGLSML